jgi:thiosulfate dehydrogenase [quinone] large subunit
MTRQWTYILTAFAVALFALLTWAFADDQFSTLWNDEDWISSALITFGFIGLIALAGFYQARRLPEAGVTLAPTLDTTTPGQTDDPRTWKLLIGNTYFALVWLPLRLFVGREWFSAGWHKVTDDAWMSGGTALVSGNPEAPGYWERIVTIPQQGRPAITYGWYREFIQYLIDNDTASAFGKAIAVGELLVGVGLIVGGLVGIAAFFGTLMNFNFMLAGSASSNPVLFGLSVFLILAWKTAGYFGVDRVLLPYLGAPWQPGKLLQRGQRLDERPAHA